MTHEPDFWNNHKFASNGMRTLTRLKGEISDWREIEDQANTLGELLDLAIEEGEDGLQETLAEDASTLSARLAAMEFRLVLSGQYDERNAIIALHAGAGGIESQDWARMLMRMYIRWAERQKHKVDVLDVSSGDEGGIKSAIIQISGPYSYGHLKAERGVHRLVRLSPFDADHARHTSFALVEALPEAEEGADIQVKPEDVKIEVFRAGGAGGQSVQKNSTAVRITHVPTGLKVSCQNERSQHQNKEIAMRILTARLVERENARLADERSKLKGEHVSAEWGRQIRSYVLHPYQMVKDHRTLYQVSDAQDVLNGNLEQFMRAYLTETVA